MRADDDEKKPRFDTRKRIALFVGLVLLTGLAFGIVSKLVEQTNTVHYSYPSITTIELDVDAGDIKLTSSAGTSVEIDAKSTHVLRDPSVKRTTGDGTLKINQDCSDFNIGPCNTKFTIAVPTGVSVKVDSVGKLDADGVRGDISVDDGNSVKGKDLYGKLDLKTGAGPIELDKLSSLDVKAVTEKGKVTLKFDVSPVRVDVESESGSAKVDVPSNSTKYKVDATTANGKSVVDVPNDQNSDRSIRVRTQSGDVEVS